MMVMDTNSPPPKLLPLPAMARRLYVTQKWLRAEAEAGRIPSLNAGGRILFEPFTVETLLAERAVACQKCDQ